MKKAIAIFLGAVLAISASQPANSVENGISAKNDTRVVSLYRGDTHSGTPTIFFLMCSGFLISDRIVATAQHCTHDGQKKTPLLVTEIFVGKPGMKSTIANGHHYSVAKIYRAENFKFYSAQTDLSFTNDVAVLVLSQPVPNVAPAKMLSEVDFANYIQTNPSVWIGGYGFQSLADRNSMSAGPRIIYPAKAQARFVARDEFQAAITFWKQKWNRTNFQENLIGLKSKVSEGTICDTDSGSGFWSTKGKDTIFLGTMNGTLGIPNCFGQPQDNEFAYYGVQATYQYQYLYDQANRFVTDNPAKGTIICKKGKKSKKITSLHPTCPVGYKS